MKTDSPNLDARQVENQNKTKNVLFSIKFSGLGYRRPWPFLSYNLYALQYSFDYDISNPYL